ncbi:MAG: hypothetical protein PHO02_04730 [Candidatus Nanoarchaeia archaeon]|nr:hypothetical protein [Candidatus Nanoarchaeia archaeon]
MRIIFAAIAFCVFLLPAYAQYGTLAGIDSESPVYMGYNDCIDSCKNCEDNCKFNAYRMAAEIESNEKLCNYLPEDMKEMCTDRVYSAKATAAKDNALCEKVTMEEEKKMCLLNVQIEKAISKRDETECSSAPEGLETACIYSYSMRLALESRDAASCDMISDTLMRINCIAAVQGTAIEPYNQEYNTKQIRVSSKLPFIFLLAAIIIAVALFSGRKQKIINKKANHAKNKRA